MLIKGFKGYTSKSDEIHDDPAMASSMKNCIINKGDICNHPYAVDFALQARGTGGHIGFGSYLGSLRDPDTGKFFSNQVFYRVQPSKVLISTSIHLYFNNALEIPLSRLFTDLGHVNTSVVGQTQRIGSWIHLFPGAIADSIDKSSDHRNIKIAVREGSEDDNDVTGHLATGVGIYPPTRLVWRGDSTTSGGGWSATIDFAITLMKRPPNPGGFFAMRDKSQLLPDGAIESNAVTLDNEHTYSNTEAQIWIYLPRPLQKFETIFSNILEPGFSGERLYYAGVYARLASELEYHFIGYFPLSDPEVVSGDVLRAEVNINSITANSSRLARTFGRSPPYRYTQMVAYRGRIYRNVYQTVTRWYDAQNTAQEEQLNANRIQVSPDLEILTRDTGLSIVNQAEARRRALDSQADYVDNIQSFNVGEDVDAEVTGLVEFHGQLIIFTEEQTFVLTAPRELGGELRTLWADRGCVTIGGRTPYILIDGILYFLSDDGLYAWDGQTAAAMRISEIISEDFQEAMRLSKNECAFFHHPEYRLLYISFARTGGCFVFHYGEGGAWSYFNKKMIVYLNKEIDGKVYMVLSNRFTDVAEFGGIYQLGKITDRAKFRDDETPNVFDSFWEWEWESVRWLNSTRSKQYKELTILSSTRVDLSPFQRPSLLNRLPSWDITLSGDRWEDGQSQFTETLQEEQKLVHIGMYLQNLQIKLFSSTLPYLNTQPFRINGFTLTMQQRGRR